MLEYCFVVSMFFEPFCQKTILFCKKTMSPWNIIIYAIIIIYTIQVHILLVLSCLMSFISFEVVTVSVLKNSVLECLWSNFFGNNFEGVHRTAKYNSKQLV